MLKHLISRKIHQVASCLLLGSLRAGSPMRRAWDEDKRPPAPSPICLLWIKGPGRSPQEVDKINEKWRLSPPSLPLPVSLWITHSGLSEKVSWRHAQPLKFCEIYTIPTVCWAGIAILWGKPEKIRDTLLASIVAHLVCHLFDGSQSCTGQLVSFPAIVHECAISNALLHFLLS